MKRIITLLTGICFALTGFAQEDTVKISTGDTIRVGSMIIIKKGDGKTGSSSNIEINKRKEYKKSNVTTNWWILDLGMARFDDQTNYSSAAIQNPLTGFAPGSDKDWFKLRNGKSVNVNIWFFMQRLNVIKNVVNLKYGMGLELNNYRYSRQVTYLTDPTKVILVDPVINKYSKNKLAADYLTVPLMLNINFTPNRKNGFGLSAGVSAGYLYSSRQKIISGGDGKQKEKDDFDLRPFKISYVGELQLGPVKLYGSLATQSMFEKGLDQTPYNIGLRFSNW